MELKTSFDFDFKAKAINDSTSESTVFVSHIDCNDDAIACSGNGFVKLYDIHNGKVITYFGTGQKSLSDMQFANKHPNLLCTSSSMNGVVAVYDVRSNNKKNSKAKSKQICLLKSPNKNKENNALYSVTMDDHRIVASGMRDIYVWDKRMLSNRNNARCYTLNNYHCDDVTKVLFNPLCKNETDTHLFSISEDTLMNHYNLSNIKYGGMKQQESDDSLVSSYSLEKELWNFGFFEQNQVQSVYALTIDESLIVHKINDNDDDAKKQSQEDDMKLFETKALDHMTLIDCFYDQNYKQLCLLSCNKNGKLRLSSVSSNDVSVLSESMDGHHARVRCAKYVPAISCLFTGGEDNCVAMWKFDPINIKPNIIESNAQKHIPDSEQHLFSGYGAHRTANKRNTTAYKPY